MGHNKLNELCPYAYFKYLAETTPDTRSSLRVKLENKHKTIEGHTRTCTLKFNGRTIWGPRGCHDNTIDLKDAIETADPRFNLYLERKPKSIEGHTKYISVISKGKVTLDKLSTHDNMQGFIDAIESAVGC